MSSTDTESADLISAAIASGATSPKSVTTDSGSVTARDIDEMRKAETHLRAKAAATSPPFGLKLARIQFGSPL